MKAAAKSYFGKSLDQLTLAQDAILAAIPQSPTKFDLVRNADEVCLENVAEGQECTKFKLVVPQDSEIVQRRNHVLDLMKTRSPLTGNKHTPAEYEAAKEEPVELHPADLGRLEGTPLRLAGPSRARSDVLPGHPERLPRGRHRGLHGHHHPRLDDAADGREVGLRRGPRPELQGPGRDPEQPQDPQGATGRGSSACAATTSTTPPPRSTTTGPARSSPTSGRPATPRRATRSSSRSSTSWPTAGGSPGRRSSPIDYAIGIDDKTLTASTMLMDVTTNFGGGFIPTQADKLERGPVRLRSALQFSLNIPAIKATIMSGLDHVYDRDQGLRPDLSRRRPSRSCRWASARSRSTRSTCSARTARSPTAASGCRSRVIDHDHRFGRQGRSGRRPTSAPKGTQVISPAAAYIITDILAGNTDKKVNPFWGKWAIFDGKTRRPAAYKTGTTSDNRDVAAYGYVAPPADKKAPALAVGVWMGNSDNTPNDGKLSLDTSAPLWSAILTEVSKGEKIATFKPPADVQTAKVDAFTGLETGPVHDQEDHRVLRAGHRPDPEGDPPGRRLDRRRHAACCGRTAARGRRSPRASSTCPRSSPTSRPGRRPTPPGERVRRKGSGVRGGPKGTRTVVLLQRFLRAVRADVGRAVHAPGPLSARTRRRSTATRSPSRIRSRRPTAVHPAADRAGPVRPRPVQHPAARRRHRPSRARTRRSSRRRRLRRAGRGAVDLTSGWSAAVGADRVAHGAGAHAVDDQDLVEAGQAGVVEVARQRLERLVHPGPAQVERRRHRPGPLEAQLGGVRRRAGACTRRAPGRTPRRRAPARGRRRRP